MRYSFPSTLSERDPNKPPLPLRRLASEVIKQSLLDAADGHNVSVEGLRLWILVSGIEKEHVVTALDRAAAGDDAMISRIRDLRDLNLPGTRGAHGWDQGARARLSHAMRAGWKKRLGGRLTLRERLEQLAAENDGLLRIRDVLGRLIAEGAVPDKTIAYQNVHRALNRAARIDNRWSKIGPGVWEFKG